MADLTIILNEAPYGSERSWNGLRLASTCASEGMTVNVFLMGDSVAAAKAGQSTPEGYYNMANMLGSLIKKGVEVRVCGACINARGLKVEEFVEGVQRGSMKILAGWVRESRKVITF
ncbi:MAG TPA: DsrE family protein [Patescibacteria group bacterium]|nr:DsrE family protein [Patescibacteria group bacterium]